MTFTPNMPLGTQSLGQTQQKVNDNFAVINTAFGIDHAPFNNANEGYHTVIHQVPGGDPAAIVGFNSVYSKLYTPPYVGAIADTQLYNRTGHGGISQLTGNSAATEGWVWMGMLFMWGSVAFSPNLNGQKGTVNFTGGTPRSAQSIPFPNNAFAIVTGLKTVNENDTTASNSISIKNLTTTGFIWNFNSSKTNGTNTYTGFWWMAIGN